MAVEIPRQLLSRRNHTAPKQTGLRPNPVQIRIKPRPPLRRKPSLHLNIHPTQIHLPLSPSHANNFRHTLLMLSIKPRVSRGRQSLQFEHLVSESLDFAFEHQTLGFAERGYDALVNAEALEGCAVDLAAESEFGLGGGGHGCSEDMGFVLFERLDESGVVLASLEFSGEAEGFLVRGVCVWIDGLSCVN